MPETIRQKHFSFIRIDVGFEVKFVEKKFENTSSSEAMLKLYRFYRLVSLVINNNGTKYNREADLSFEQVYNEKNCIETTKRTNLSSIPSRPIE